VLFYENSIGGKKHVEEDLSRHLRAITTGKGVALSGEGEPVTLI